MGTTRAEGRGPRRDARRSGRLLSLLPAQTLLHEIRRELSADGEALLSEDRDAEGLDLIFEIRVQFLHDEEYVEGTPVPFERKGYLKSARISRKGVDLMDDPVECERMFPVKGVTAAVDAFLYEMRLELEGAELPDGEKTELFERLRRFTSHPLAARALNAVLQKYGQRT